MKKNENSFITLLLYPDGIKKISEKLLKKY